jgi:hypothetical protein
VGGRQAADDREQAADDREQAADDREQAADDREQAADDGERVADDGEQGADDGEQPPDVRSEGESPGAHVSEQRDPAFGELPPPGKIAQRVLVTVKAGGRVMPIETGLGLVFAEVTVMP